MTELTTNQTPPLAWRSGVLGPIVLLAVHEVLVQLEPLRDVNPIGPASLLVIGCLLSIPLAYGAFAALAPQPFFWRLPLTAAACLLLALLGSTNHPWQLPALFHLVLFAGVFSLLASARVATGLQLTLPDAPIDRSHNTAQFGVGHLLAWTSVVAVLTGLARILNNAGYSDDRTFWIMLTTGSGFVHTMGLIATPFLVIPRAVLTANGSVLLRLLSASFLIVLGAAAMVLALHWLEPASRADPIADTFRWHVGIGAGAAAHLLVTSIVLRWSGYRLVRTAPSGQNVDGR